MTHAYKEMLEFRAMLQMYSNDTGSNIRFMTEGHKLIFLVGDIVLMGFLLPQFTFQFY